MRHGQSKANLAGVIVSRIETDASGDYGLTDARPRAGPRGGAGVRPARKER